MQPPWSFCFAALFVCLVQAVFVPVFRNPTPWGLGRVSSDETSLDGQPVAYVNDAWIWYNPLRISTERRRSHHRKRLKSRQENGHEEGAGGVVRRGFVIRWQLRHWAARRMEHHHSINNTSSPLWKSVRCALESWASAPSSKLMIYSFVFCVVVRWVLPLTSPTGAERQCGRVQMPPRWVKKEFGGGDRDELLVSFCK